MVSRKYMKYIHHVAEDCNLTLNIDTQLNVKQVRGGATSCRAGNNHRFAPSLYFTIVLTFSFLLLPPSLPLPPHLYLPCITFTVNYRDKKTFNIEKARLIHMQTRQRPE